MGVCRKVASLISRALGSESWRRGSWVVFGALRRCISFYPYIGRGGMWWVETFSVCAAETSCSSMLIEILVDLFCEVVVSDLCKQVEKRSEGISVSSTRNNVKVDDLSSARRISKAT